MRIRSLIARTSTVIAMATFAVGARADSPPQRIVSLNLCIDQLVVDLVPRERIAGVSRLATDRSLSANARKLDGLMLLRGTAEEVLALKPDLILAGEYTTGATIDLLRRLGQNVVVVPLAADFDQMRAGIRQIAKAVGETARGDAMIAAFDERLSEARSTVPSRPTALVYEVGGLVAGPQSLMNAALDAAGYRNLAAEARVSSARRLPLERLVAHPPDLIVLANAPGDYRTVLADNLRHPALARLIASRPSVVLPAPYWICATPKIAEAVEILAGLKTSRHAASESAR